jgi:hypothetical protein
MNKKKKETKTKTIKQEWNYRERKLNERIYLILNAMRYL